MFCSTVGPVRRFHIAGFGVNDDADGAERQRGSCKPFIRYLEAETIPTLGKNKRKEVHDVSKATDAEAIFQVILTPGVTVKRSDCDETKSNTQTECL